MLNTVKYAILFCLMVSSGQTTSLALMETANSGNEITPIYSGYNTTCNGGSISGMEEYIYEEIF